MILQWIIPTLLLALKATSSAAGGELAVIAWVRANGGYVSDKVEFRHLDSNDETSPTGLFAKEPLEEDETIMTIPYKCVLKSPAETECALARSLAYQFRLGENSFFRDYVNYLFDGTHRGRLPDRWSDEAEVILMKILGEELPSPFIGRSFEEFCGGSSGDEEIEEDAYEFVGTRSWTKTRMVPLLDMINHRNGRWINVESTSAHVGKDIQIFALRNVEAGEQLYKAFGECTDDDCEDILDKYGTQEIIRDHGFVEQYPQRWIWEFQGMDGEISNLVFDLDKAAVKDPYSGEVTDRYLPTWHHNGTGLLLAADLGVMNVMTNHLTSLNRLESYVQEATGALESEHERRVIQEYYQSLRRALQYAIWSYYDGSIDELGDAIDYDDEEDTASQPPSHRYYDDLEWRHPIGNPDETYPPICNLENNGGFERREDFEGYEKYETGSQYQKIVFSHSFEDDHTIIYLNGDFHCCTSTRIIQEPLVHYPASFLPEIKRVAYIGGGTNLILHEVLKYPSLELVVGMELDQQVVRNSFKYMGTRPYFDDPRVEWWFADAAKSLLALPNEYFGSFDLVIVDLVDLIANSLSVTADMSLMEVVPLLAKPNGIISKQEDVPIREITNFARYTVDLDYCDVADICRQSITIGSNGINFLTAPQYDHGIDRLYLKQTLEPETKFDNWSSFRDNNELDDRPAGSSTTPTFVKQDANPNHAILMVIEAEELSGIVKTKDEVLGALCKALEANGISAESVYGRATDHILDFDVALVFSQGYVVARKRSTASNYLAIDLLLWDAISKANNLKRGILKSIGGSEDTASSYRVLTVGPGGVGETPHILNRPRKPVSDPPPNLERAMDSTDVNAAWSALVNLIPVVTPSVVVLCGPADEVCTSLEALKANSVDVIPLFTCNNIEATEFSSNRLLFQCEMEMMASLRASMVHKFNGIVLDSTATITMARVFLRLLTGIVGREELLNERNYVVVAELAEDEEWREIFVERFRTEISPFAPAKEARLSFLDGSSYSVFVAGEEQFYKKLASLMDEVKTTLDNDVHVDQVMSGQLSYIRDFAPKWFKTKDFDNTEAYKQWISQQPNGYQTIIQMDLKVPLVPLKEGDTALRHLNDIIWAPCQVAEVNEDNMYSIIGLDGILQREIPRHQLRRIDADPAATRLPQFEPNTSVLIRRDKHVWVQGYVVWCSEDLWGCQVRDESSEDDGDENTRWVVDSNDLLPLLEPPRDIELPTLSRSIVDNGLRSTLERVLDGDAASTIQQAVHGVGDGCVISSFWQGGNVFLVWDGSNSIGINLYLQHEEDIATAEAILSEFAKEIPYLALSAREEQPRGYGRVVNFSNHIQRDIAPVWWPDQTDSVLSAV